MSLIVPLTGLFWYHIRAWVQDWVVLCLCPISCIVNLLESIVPYQSSGGRRNNVQLGVGRSVWAGTPPPAIPERTLDGIPGCMAWLALLFSITCAIAFPRALLLIAALLGFYSAVRFLFAGIANVMGLRYIKQWEATNWHERYQAEATPDALDWNAVKHIVIIPNYKEPFEILTRTLDNLAAQYQAKQRMTVMLAMEAGEEGCVVRSFLPHGSYPGRPPRQRRQRGPRDCRRRHRGRGWSEALEHDLDHSITGEVGRSRSR